MERQPRTPGYFRTVLNSIGGEKTKTVYDDRQKMLIEDLIRIHGENAVSEFLSNVFEVILEKNPELFDEGIRKRSTKIMLGITIHNPRLVKLRKDIQNPEFLNKIAKAATRELKNIQETAKKRILGTEDSVRDLLLLQKYISFIEEEKGKTLVRERKSSRR